MINNLIGHWRLIALLTLFSTNLIAERCPTPEEVRNREITREYEWTVNEEVSLQALLSVTTLYAVQIENYGEFIACKYEANQQFIRLDGVPAKKRCPIQAISEEWFQSEGGQSVCDEKDLKLCLFEFHCAEEE